MELRLPGEISLFGKARDHGKTQGGQNEQGGVEHRKTATSFRPIVFALPRPLHTRASLHSPPFDKSNANSRPLGEFPLR
jgi:hypothetical protein